MASRYWISREVIESIEIEAENEDEAEIFAAETPIAEWMREIKSTNVDIVLP